MEAKFPGFLRASEWLTGEKKEAFAFFYALLLEYNKKFNLTAVTEEKDVYYKHFYDSLAGEFLFPQGAACAEIGSGAGFPSLPLCIARKDLRFTLFESVRKKCEFLQIAAERLVPGQVKVCCLRAEEGARDAAFREKFDVCCARAVARMNTLTEYCLPFLRLGGRMIAYKGREEEEFSEAERAIEVLGGKTEQIYRYELPQGYGSRTLAVVKKIRHTPSLYPRGRGKERKDPIV